jgi:large subunit ribosomal protein L4
VSEVAVRTPAGASAGTIELDPHWFGITPNGPVMHQVVVAQLAKRRSGTQSTKTRAEISRSGAKSRRQKGGGTSRQGSMRGPQWVGGGVALGPRPRSYAQRTPKKMINLALRSALSDRAGDGRVIVVNEWAFATPKTKDALVALKALGIEGRALVVLNGSNDGDVRAARSFGNLQEVQLIDAGELNAYDVLVNDYIVFTSATVPGQTKNEQQQAPASEETA